jgi:hypothetical protein
MKKKNYDKKVALGIGDWGLGIGDWGLGIGPNTQYPIPNPQFFKNYLLNLFNKKNIIFKFIFNIFYYEYVI